MASPALAQTKYRFVVVPKAMNNPFFDVARDGCLKRAKELGNVECIYKGPIEHEPATQAQIIQDFVTQKVDGLAISVADVAAMTRSIDAAVAAGIPVVHASVFRFEGQLTVFQPYDGPCYRCLYPTPPPPELAPGCSVAGVLGVVPGIMGLLQTNEALKILLGIGDTLAGRLLLFDALDATFTELRLRRDPKCPVCSDAAVEARKAGRPLAVAAVGGDAPFVLGART
jgi:hypothetical protein